MVTPVRRISLSIASRPWLYWASVGLLAMFTGLSIQHLTKPAAATVASCPFPTMTAAEASTTRGVALPLGDPALPVHAGDHVDIVGIARNVRVLTVSETAAVLAVSDHDVDAVVAALRSHTTTLVLVQARAPYSASTASPASTR